MKSFIATGCGFYLTVALISLLTMAVNAYGLTTFGKTQNNQQPAAQQPTIKGRECTFEIDCQGIQNTSCVPDPRDDTSRCLCGDNQVPVNGACKSKFKGPKHSCMMDEECVEGGECVPDKSGGTRAAVKICKCREGLHENGHLCSGSPMGKWVTTGLLAATILLSRTNILY